MNNGDTFVTETIFEYYFNEFCSRNVDYVDFISSKHLGIEAVFEDKRLGKRCYYCTNYKITDEKVWLLNKIRHGF